MSRHVLLSTVADTLRRMFADVPQGLFHGSRLGLPALPYIMDEAQIVHGEEAEGSSRYLGPFEIPFNLWEEACMSVHDSSYSATSGIPGQAPPHHGGQSLSQSYLGWARLPTMRGRERQRTFDDPWRQKVSNLLDAAQLNYSDASKRMAKHGAPVGVTWLNQIMIGKGAKNLDRDEIKRRAFAKVLGVDQRELLSQKSDEDVTEALRDTGSAPKKSQPHTRRGGSSKMEKKRLIAYHLRMLIDYEGVKPKEVMDALWDMWGTDITPQPRTKKGF